MACPFSSKEEVYQYICKFLRSNPSKTEIYNKTVYLVNLATVECSGDVKNTLVGVIIDLVNLYYNNVTLSSLINKYCPKKATLNISTSPSGANVYVDGEYKGIT